MKKSKAIVAEAAPDKRMLFALCFAEGFLIMATEIFATGLISPHYGQSLSVLTFVLGITMFSLASGYFFGSRLAQKTKLFKLTVRILFLYIVSLTAMPYIAKQLFRAAIDLDLISSLLLCVLPFLFLPLFLIGSLSPLLIRMLNQNDSNVGLNSSRVYVASTLGGVLAALLVAFVLLENLSIYSGIFVLSLLSCGLIIYVIHKSQSETSKKAAYIFSGFLILFYVATAERHFKEPLPKTYHELYYSDGIMGQIRIVDNTIEHTRSLYTNNTIQTFSMIDGKNVWEYIAKISKLIQANKGKTLLAGLGGGVLINNIESDRYQVDIVDVDERMFEIATKFYKLGEKENISFYTDDIRHYIKLTPEKYDNIVLDLSASENVPSHVYTLESFREMKKKLSKKGIVLIHYFSDFKAKGQQSIDAISHTLQQAGFSVKMVPTEHKKNELSSIVFLAHLNPLSTVFEGFALTGSNPKNKITLTDDKPYLDVLRKDMVAFTRETYISDYHSNWKVIRDLGLNR